MAPAQSRAAERPLSRLLVVTAIEGEARRLARGLGLAGSRGVRWPHFEGPGVTIIAAGLRAKALTDRWPATRPRLVVSAGICGGLSPTLGDAGILALPRTVRRHDGFEWSVDDAAHAQAVLAALAAGCAFTTEPLVTVDHIVDTLDAKLALGDETGAVAVDLESAVVLETAAAAGVPGLVVRAVSDPVDRVLPLELVSLVGDDGRPRAAAAGALLARRPALLADALALRRGVARALRSVAVVIQMLVRGR